MSQTQTKMNLQDVLTKLTNKLNENKTNNKTQVVIPIHQLQQIYECLQSIKEENNQIASNPELQDYEKNYIKVIEKHLINGELQEIQKITNSTGSKKNNLTPYENIWEIIKMEYIKFKQLQNNMIQYFKFINLQFTNQITLASKLIELFNKVREILNKTQNFKKLKQKNDVISQLTSDLRQKNQKINKQQNQIKQLSSQIDKIEKSISGKSQIFENTERDQQFVIKQLNNYLKEQTIVGYHQLYQSKTSIYLNGVLYNQPNTLLLIRTKQGHTVAGFSSLSYCQNKDMEQTKGLLISTLSQKAYPLKQQKKPIKSDNKYLIFGNNEIKINKKNWNVIEVEINENSVFDVSQHKNLDIFGQDSDKIEIQSFEIYQIILKQCTIIQKSEGLKCEFYPNRLFIGDIIQEEEDRQYIIREVLNQHPNQKIVRTKLLYSYQLMSLINPHVKIDDIPNYLVILTFKNLDNNNKPYMIAMYSEKPLKKQSELNKGKGFIASVSNRTAFGLIKTDKNARLTEYNLYYLVYGKGEIQFRIGSNEMQFNIGHIYKSLNTETRKDPTIFSGKPDEKTEIKGYEIYQIFLENDNDK